MSKALVVESYFATKYNVGKVSRDGFPLGFKKYLFYVLHHEFKHTIDRELKVSGRRSVSPRSIELGREKLDYYKEKGEYWA